jgi:hypothetical protein
MSLATFARENHGVGLDTWNAVFPDDSSKRGLRCRMNG